MNITEGEILRLIELITSLNTKISEESFVKIFKILVNEVVVKLESEVEGE
jgi:hypothetical protein